MTALARGMVITPVLSMHMHTVIMIRSAEMYRIQVWVVSSAAFGVEMFAWPRLAMLRVTLLSASQFNALPFPIVSTIDVMPR